MDPRDHLNERLHAAGDAIAVDDDFAALTAVQDGVARRRKRRRVVTGVGVSALLVAGGVVAVGVLGDGESDSLSIAGVDEPAPTTTVDEPAAGAADTDETNSDGSVDAAAPPPPTTVPPAANGGIVVETIDATATFVPVPADLSDAQLNWVVPWQDGFLASRTLFVPQALPSELPEEIAALFPQEVIDFFDGDLPPTIGEATTMLSEAGLLDEVTAVLAEHPEASEAIYSEPTAAPSVNVVFSPNGIDWEPIEFAMPNDAEYATIQSTGDRLVAVVEDFGFAEEIAGSVDAGPVEDSGGFVERAPTIEFAVTSDLVTWTTLAMPSLAPATELPPFVRVSTYPNSLAVNAAGWVASVGLSYDIDVRQLMPLVPADVAGVADSSGFNGGTFGSVTPDGVTLYFYDEQQAEPQSPDEPPRPTEPRTFELSWDELGVAPAVAAQLGTDRSTLVSARWNGETTVVDGVDAYQIVGTADGFYAVDDVVSFSPDGAEWIELSTPASTRFVLSALSLDSGVVVFGVDGDGEPTAFRVDGATDTWTAVQVPDLPSNFIGGYFGNDANGRALVVDVSDDRFVEEQDVTVEVDGYTVTFNSSELFAGFRLVDAAGAVLVEDQFSPRGDLPDSIRSDEDGFTFVDVESGEDIVTVSFEQLSAGYDAVPVEDFEEPVPDLWVLATLDGERWLFEDLGLGDDEGFYGATPVAINGTTVLVAVGSEWQVFDLS